MKPTTMTISDLFGPNKRYLVPLFQRPYVWSRERQWEPLWEDIKNKANELIEDAYGRTLRNHFLGAVVLNTIKTYGRHISAIDVIDGQQRLTTLQLVLIALRDFMTVYDYAGHTDSIRRLIKNDHWREFPEEQYKVWPTISDRDVFTEMVQAQSLATLNQKFPLVRKRYTSRFESRPQIIEAYAYFYQAIETFVALPTDQDVTDPDAIIPRLDAIIEAITHHLELVVIELEDRDDPQIIFETLNARGEPLLPSDLIRNLVFLDIAQTTSDQVETWYQTYWRPYDQTDDQGRNFWKASERQGRINRPRLDLFLFHYLSYKTEHDIPITHLFQEFREWWRKKPQQTEAALQDLRHFSNIFRQFYESTTSSRLSIFAKRLRILDTSTVYPLLLFLLGECSLATTERDGVITDLESYLVRRMICGMTNKNYNRVFISLLRQLRQSGQVSRSALQNHLLSLEGESVRWPTNE